MRCGIYTRVSADERAQAEHNSLQLQAELRHHYVEVQWEQGRAVAGVYEDAGYSGKDLNRAAVQRPPPCPVSDCGRHHRLQAGQDQPLSEGLPRAMGRPAAPLNNTPHE